MNADLIIVVVVLLFVIVLHVSSTNLERVNFLQYYFMVAHIQKSKVFGGGDESLKMTYKLT